MKTIYTKMPKVKKANFNVFRLNLMTIILLLSAINFSLQAQETFPPVDAPNGALIHGNTSVTINLNDIANSAGIAPGVYDSFEVTVDWFYDNGEPEDAGLTVVTSSGNTDFTTPTNVIPVIPLDATLVFSGDFASPYMPDSDGTLDLILSQGSNPNTGGYWLNIQVTIFDSTCLAPTNLSLSNSTSSSIQLNWTASTSTETGGYEYFLTTESDEVPTSNTTPTGSVPTGVTSANLTGLPSTPVHNVFVRTVCSPGNVSPWSPKESFVLSIPELNWLKTNMDNAFGLTSTVDSQNNVIVVASGPSFLSPKTMYVRKYDVNGNLLMQTSVDALDLAGGNSDNLLPYQVETDSQDNIIIAGVNTIINTSTSSSCQTPPCYISVAAKIIKFAPDGQLVFNKTMPDHSNSYKQLRVDDNYLEIDDNDNIYYNGVGGITDTSNVTDFGSILVKLAPDGTTLFTDVENIIGNGNSIAPGLMALGNNFIAVVNRTPNDTPPQKQITAWDDNGNVLWNVNLDSDIEKFRAIVVDPATNDTYVLAETFPPNPLLTKIDSNGNILYTQTYSFGEDAVPKGLGFVSSDKLAFAGTTFSDLSNDSSLYTKVVNTSDGSSVSDHTYAQPQSLSRVRDFETNASNGTYYITVESSNSGGAPSLGSLHGYDLNGNEWHVGNLSSSVRSVALGQGSEIYLMTDNVWDLYQFTTPFTLSTQDFIDNDFKVYPNPVKNELFVNTQTEPQFC